MSADKPHGRRLDSRVVQITLVATTDQQVLNPNPRRIAIIFTGGVTTAVTFDPNTIAAAGAGAVAANLSSGSVILTERDVGDLVKGAWHAFGAAAGPAAVTEIFYLDDTPSP